MGHRAEQRDSVAEAAASDDLAGIGILRLFPLVLAASRDHIDEIHGAMDVAARNLEEIVPAVHLGMALGRVLHIETSEDIRLIPSMLVHVSALQSRKPALWYPRW